jgi:DNA-binding transcriptional regulator YiaG
MLLLTTEDFATRYRLPVELLRAWEDGTAKPEAVTEAFLLATALEPDVIAKALAPREPRATATHAKTAAE